MVRSLRPSGCRHRVYAAARAPAAAALVATLVAALALVLAPLEAAPKRDYAAAAWTILPPGENGSLTFDRNTTDQAKLYDALTPLFGSVTARDIRRFFKPAPLGRAPWRAEARAPSARPHDRPRSLRRRACDREDRGRRRVRLGLGHGRRPRAAAATHPRAGTRLRPRRARTRPACPRAVREELRPERRGRGVSRESARRGPRKGVIGRKVLALINAYAAGINGYYRSKGIPVAPFTANDVVASAALIAARSGRMGAGGAQRDVPRRARGPPRRRRCPPRLRRPSRGERPGGPGQRARAVPPAAPVGERSRECRDRRRQLHRERRSTLRPWPRTRFSSVRSARRPGTRSSSPGPRSGTSSRSSSPRWSFPAPGFAVRGAVFPGVPLVLVGRGPDFAWSATSSQADNLDLFVETLCDDDRHYLYRGQCEPMRRFFVGTLKAQGSRSTGRVLRDHPRAGHRVRDRSGQACGDLGAAVDQRPRAPEHTRVLRAQHRPRDVGPGLPADDERGRVQLQLVLRRRSRHRAVLERTLARAGAGTDPALPTLGTGDYDWRGFLPFEAHARGINPPSGAILNWNNKPAPTSGRPTPTSRTARCSGSICSGRRSQRARSTRSPP